MWLPTTLRDMMQTQEHQVSVIDAHGDASDFDIKLDARLAKTVSKESYKGLPLMRWRVVGQRSV